MSSMFRKTEGMALWDLAMKCHDSSHIISRNLVGSPYKPLMDRQLINTDETIPEYVREVVVNSVKNIDKIKEANMFSIRLQNPYKEEEKVSTHKWSWRSIFKG